MSSLPLENLVNFKTGHYFRQFWAAHKKIEEKDRFENQKNNFVWLCRHELLASITHRRDRSNFELWSSSHIIYWLEQKFIFYEKWVESNENISTTCLIYLSIFGQFVALSAFRWIMLLCKIIFSLLKWGDSFELEWRTQINFIYCLLGLYWRLSRWKRLAFNTHEKGENNKHIIYMKWLLAAAAELGSPSTWTTQHIVTI